MRFWMRAIALLLALCCCTGALFGCSRTGEPLIYVKDRAEYTLQESLVGELLSFLLQTLQGGSVKLTFGGTDLASGLPEEAELALFLNAEEERLAAIGAMKLNGALYDASLWVNNEHAVLNSPSFLGSNTLGMNFETLREDLKTSIFSNNSGTAYAIPEVTVATADSVIAFKESFFDLLASFDDTKELADEALECFLEILATNAQNTRYREKGRTYVSLTVDNDALSRSLRETRAVLVKNRAFCRELRGLAKSLDDLNAAREGVVSNEYTTKLEYFLTSESDMDAICLAIDSAAPFAFSLDATVRNFGGKLEVLDCRHLSDGKTVLDLSLRVAPPDEQSTLAVTYLGVRRELSYQVQKDSFRDFEAELSYKKSTADEVLLDVIGKLSANRRDDSFVFTLDKGSESRSFIGTYAFDEQQLALSVSQLNLNGEPHVCKLTLELQALAAMPEMPEYVNVVTIDSKRYTPIFERATQTNAALQQALEGAELTPYNLLGELLSLFGLEEELPPPSDT